MALTYDLTTSIGKVRLNIGDTSLTNAFFTDEEIQVYLTNGSGDINSASADLLEAMAAAYVSNPDSEKIGDYNYAQTNVTKMLKLAATFRARSENTPVQSFTEPDLSGIPDSDLAEMG